MKNDLKVIENDGLIKVYEGKEGFRLVNGRELWQGLGVNKAFSTWIKTNLQNVDALENKDYSCMWVDENGASFKGNLENTSVVDLTGQGFKLEYILKIDIAKEICMVAGAMPRANKELKSKSKAYRKYLINIEKKYEQLQKDLIEKNSLILNIVNGKTEEERAVALSQYKEKVDKDLAKKDEIINKQKPKVQMFKRFMESKGLLTVGNVAKLFNERLNKNKTIGKNRLYEILRNEEILMSSSTEWNIPYQRFIDQGYFEVKFDSYEVHGEEISTSMTFVTKKGSEWLWKMLVRKEYVKTEDLIN